MLVFVPSINNTSIMMHGMTIRWSCHILLIAALIANLLLYIRSIRNRRLSGDTTLLLWWAASRVPAAALISRRGSSFLKARHRPCQLIVPLPYHWMELIVLLLEEDNDGRPAGPIHTEFKSAIPVTSSDILNNHPNNGKTKMQFIVLV